MYYLIGSASVSGATLNVSGTFPFAASDTVVFDVAASATLTDSGGNTPLGQTGVMVANGSTRIVATFSASNAAFKLQGPWVQNGFGGRTYRTFTINGRLDFKATGTDIAIVTAFSPAQQVSFDGGFSNHGHVHPRGRFDMGNGRVRDDQRRGGRLVRPVHA